MTLLSFFCSPPAVEMMVLSFDAKTAAFDAVDSTAVIVANIHHVLVGTA